ncbi:lysozyme family protein [Lapidilactobacillus mulanensis]|uniref:Lysozyme family protein n=2 Tax=Lactobacillaceae TaxID=33958 RepID=A0ABW4DNG5_9LACO|nr:MULTISPECIES: bifunctional lytic transglycosylase/C40 family peptidase [Lactobacillaceae]
MKIKKWIVLAAMPLLLISLLFFSVAIVGDDDEDQTMTELAMDGMNLSPEVLKYKAVVEKYCKEFGISDQVMVILSIMQVESGGKGSDVMQSSESLGQSPGSLSPDASIKQGVKYFASLIKSIKSVSADTNTAIQSYNYGGGFVDYVAKHGKKYSFENASNFAKDKASGRKVTYTNPVSDGWRYAYGNMYYVKLVSQYLTSSGSANFSDKTVKAIMTEALKYQGTAYVFGGGSPSTGFDCSGITQWSFGKAGIKLPRTAQAQYDFTNHVPIKSAKPGDLVFFHSTYACADYVTHVGIYVGNMRMYNAGDPLGYADLKSTYWQAHLIGAGRIKK